MKRGTYVKLFAISISAALVLSVISLLCLIKFSDLAFRDHRQNLLIFMARTVESNPSGLILPEFGPFRGPGGPGRPGGHHHEGPPPFREDMAREDHFPMPPPPPPDGDGRGWPPPPPPDENGPRFGPPPPMGGMLRPPPPPMVGEMPEFWIVSEKGEILSGDKSHALPSVWMKLKKPTEVHGIVTDDTFWNIFDRTTVLKLDHTPTAYLVLLEHRNPFRGPLFLTQGIFTFATVVIALFFALSITFIYLRKKSEEARDVLLRLERGDLKARFEVKPFDEFGGLIVDFNRMANEIERLVNRVRETESARSNLLSELGHDLRTPLTSLTTSFETLKFHFNKMTPSDRNEIFTMITAEVEYFKELLEKLMTIAELDEPHYKKSTEVIDLNRLVQQEIRFRQSNNGANKEWSFSAEGPGEVQADVLGDPHLLLRLLKNALDNASRYAKTKVHVTLHDRGDDIEVSVSDDGPGMDKASLAAFGKRQDRRKRREESAGLNFSLGLGSVIMRTIAELHGGRLEVANIETQNGVSGAVVKVSIPKYKE